MSKSDNYVSLLKYFLFSRGPKSCYWVFFCFSFEHVSQKANVFREVPCFFNDFQKSRSFSNTYANYCVLQDGCDDLSSASRICQIEKCHTSKLILRISWINYVLAKCHRWFIMLGRATFSCFRVRWVWRIGSVLVHVSQFHESRSS